MMHFGRLGVIMLLILVGSDLVFGEGEPHAGVGQNQMLEAELAQIREIEAQVQKGIELRGDNGSEDVEADARDAHYLLTLSKRSSAIRQRIAQAKEHASPAEHRAPKVSRTHQAGEQPVEAYRDHLRGLMTEAETQRRAIEKQLQHLARNEGGQEQIRKLMLEHTQLGNHFKQLEVALAEINGLLGDSQAVGQVLEATQKNLKITQVTIRKISGDVTLLRDQGNVAPALLEEFDWQLERLRDLVRVQEAILERIDPGSQNDSAVVLELAQPVEPLTDEEKSKRETKLSEHTIGSGLLEKVQKNLQISAATERKMARDIEALQKSGKPAPSAIGLYTIQRAHIRSLLEEQSDLVGALEHALQAGGRD